MVVFIHSQFFLSQSQASKRPWYEEGRDFRKDIVPQILLHENGFSVSNFKPGMIHKQNSVDEE